MGFLGHAPLRNLFRIRSFLELTGDVSSHGKPSNATLTGFSGFGWMHLRSNVPYLHPMRVHWTLVADALDTPLTDFTTLQDEKFLWQCLLGEQATHAGATSSQNCQPQLNSSAQGTQSDVDRPSEATSGLSINSRNSQSPDWSAFLPLDHISSPDGLRQLSASLAVLQDCAGNVLLPLRASPVWSASTTVTTPSNGRGAVAASQQSHVENGGHAGSDYCSQRGMTSRREHLMALQAAFKKTLQRSGTLDAAASYAASGAAAGQLPRSSPAESPSSIYEENAASTSPSDAPAVDQNAVCKPDVGLSDAQKAAQDHKEPGAVRLHSKPRGEQEVQRQLLRQQQQQCLKLVSELLAPPGASVKQD